MGFVDGSSLCPPRLPTPTSNNSEVHSSNYSSSEESDEFTVWKMHDYALMQLLIATLSFPALSYVIGSISACDMWTRLKEQFSIVTCTSIFQLKFDLQNINEGADSITTYLQRIKEARDYITYHAPTNFQIAMVNGASGGQSKESSNFGS